MSAIIFCQVVNCRLRFYHTICFTIFCILFLCCSVITIQCRNFSHAWFLNYVELCVFMTSWGCQNIDPVDLEEKCKNALYNNDICSGKFRFIKCFSVVVSFACFTPIKIWFQKQNKYSTTCGLTSFFFLLSLFFLLCWRERRKQIYSAFKWGWMDLCDLRWWKINHHYIIVTHNISQYN